MDGSIRLFVTDLDHTLNPDEGAPFDLTLLAEVQRRNVASARDPAIPPLTLITGRPQPYLYAMLQAVAGRLPGVFEHGFGMYSIVTDRLDTHPAWTADDAARRRHLVARCEAAFVEPGLARLQVGKLAALTLEPTPPHTARSLADTARKLTDADAPDFTVHVGPKVVDYVPHAFHKGLGVRWLAEALDIPPERVAAMGDSSTDAHMFAAAGLGIAPANAPDAVRAQAGYVTAAPMTAGVLEAYDALIAHNRAVASGG